VTCKLDALSDRRQYKSAMCLIAWSALACRFRKVLYVREEPGTQRYNVGTDTPKLCATSRAGVPLSNSFLAAWILLSVIRRFRPPTRP
jgi:hypothetical protein